MNEGTVRARLDGLLGRSGSLRRQLVRGGAGSAVLQGLNRILTLALGIVLARGLGAEGYGIYAYSFALMTLLLLLAEVGMPTLLMREVASSEARGDWTHLRGIIVRGAQIVFVASVTLSVAAAIVVWYCGAAVPASQRQTLLLVFLVLPFTALTRAMAGASMGLRQVIKGQAVEMVLRPALVLLGVFTIFAYAPHMRLPQYAMGIQVAVAVVALGVAAFLVAHYLPREARATSSEFRTAQWLASAVPFTLMGGAGVINSQTDILMLGFFRPAEDVGVYRVAVQGSVLVAFGLQAANAVIAPQFARLYAQGELAQMQRLVRASARAILVAAVPVAMTFMIAGGAIAGWVFGPEFVRSHIPLAILAAGQLVNAAMGSVGFLLSMTGHERDVTRTLLLTAIFNIILNLFLIPPFGMAGAAMATSISLATWNYALFRIALIRVGVNSTAF